MFCKNCGNELRDGAKFCNSCGIAVQSSTIAVPEKQTVTKETMTPMVHEPMETPIPEDPAALQDWTNVMAKSAATQAVEESAAQQANKDIVGRVYLFRRTIISYIKKTTTVTFQENDLQIGILSKKNIPYASIQCVNLKDKLNWGEVYYMGAFLFLGIMCLVGEAYVYALLAVILALLAIPVLKNTVVTVISQSGPYKIVMMKKESEKELFLQDLQTMTGCRIEIQ